jgi:hypothetical protein
MYKFPRIIQKQPSFDPEEAPGKMTDKLKQLWLVINSLTAGEFTGYIKLNFTQGIIARIEKYEEILRK